MKTTFMLRWRLLLFGGLLALGGCELGAPEHDLQIISHFYDFNDGDFGWVGGFSDYPVADSAAYELNFALSPLPANLGTGNALMLSGNNRSDDLFMYIKKKITGLKPLTEYRIGFEIKFATNAAKDAIGIGGSPGQSVYMKAGATSKEPDKVIQNGYCVMNIDKGNQISGGKDMIFIGNIESSSPSAAYTVEDRNNSVSFTATAGPDGELWIIAGTESGFEGTTTLYYTEIGVVFSLNN
jgi:hypothetical protein